MTEAYFLGADDMFTLLTAASQFVAFGIGLGLVLFILGYAIYFLINLFRGGIV